jgi:magnesium-protoporphyrin IX monomethyl ester (oxidative) cyclase
VVRIALVNMPFADVNRPSFALSQLAALLEREFGEQVDVSVHYLNLDFELYFGPELYRAINGEMEHLMTGVGEWIFRKLAFPQAPDNDAQYFNRYYHGGRWEEFRKRLEQARGGIEEFCTGLIDRHGLAGADILGFTSMFAQNLASIAMGRLVKERSPETLVVLGGANCEAPMGTVIAQRVPTVDAVFSGPALLTFPEFVRHVHEGDLEAIHRIPGVITTANAQEPRFAKAIGADRNVDDFFEPAYGGFVEAFDTWRTARPDNAAVKPVLYFETSRGCWWGQRSHCTFCGLNGLGMDYRAMSAESARRQFAWLFDYSPWCEFFFCTDNIMPKSYPREVFPHLDTPDGSTLFYEIKLPLSERDLAAMARAGVRRVQPGVEALSTETLKLMGKGTSAFLNLQFLKSCLRHDISPSWNLLMGFPREREEVFRKYVADLPLLTHLPPPQGAAMVRFDRFSPYHSKALEYGLKLAPLDFYGMSYPFDRAEIEQLAYFFSDQNLSPYMIAAIKWHKPINDLIDAWRARWAGDESERPRLAVTRNAEGGAEVLDTRGASPLRFALDEPDLLILRRLSSPLRPDRLAAELGLPAEETTERVAALRGRRLLFEEEGRLLNLVVLEEDAGAVADAEPEEMPEAESTTLRPLRMLPLAAAS